MCLRRHPVSHNIVGEVEELAGVIIGSREEIKRVVGVVDCDIFLPRPARDLYHRLIASGNHAVVNLIDPEMHAVVVRAEAIASLQQSEIYLPIYIRRSVVPCIGGCIEGGTTTL